MKIVFVGRRRENKGSVDTTEFNRWVVALINFLSDVYRDLKKSV